MLGGEAWGYGDIPLEELLCLSGCTLAGKAVECHAAGFGFAEFWTAFSSLKSGATEQISSPGCVGESAAFSAVTG